MWITFFIILLIYPTSKNLFKTYFRWVKLALLIHYLMVWSSSFKLLFLGCIYQSLQYILSLHTVLSCSTIISSLNIWNETDIISTVIGTSPSRVRFHLSLTFLLSLHLWLLRKRKNKMCPGRKSGIFSFLKFILNISTKISYQKKYCPCWIIIHMYRCRCMSAIIIQSRQETYLSFSQNFPSPFISLCDLPHFQ